jgi:hypothetical protein
MSLMDWVVLGLGMLSIAWVNWYFFFASRGPGS